MAFYATPGVGHPIFVPSAALWNDSAVSVKSTGAGRPCCQHHPDEAQLAGDGKVRVRHIGSQIDAIVEKIRKLELRADSSTISRYREIFYHSCLHQDIVCPINNETRDEHKVMDQGKESQHDASTTY
jgi:hypothetical protein